MKIIKQYCLNFIAREVNPPPLLFFCLYVYKHLQIEQPDYTAYSLFGIGLVFMVLFKFNQFYLYSPILNAGLGWLTVVNLLLGLLATNQKWKLYLFLFIIGDSITLQFQSLSQVYLMCTSFYIAVETYRNLIFKTTQENYVYFIGFCAIFVYHSTELVIQSINGYPGFSYFTIPFIVCGAYKIIQLRLYRISKQHISQINNVDLLKQYMILFRQQIKLPTLCIGLIFTHQKSCSDIDCYCRNAYLTEGPINTKIDFSTKIQYYMVKNLFETIFKNKKLAKKQVIEHFFIDFLLDNNQCIEAVETFFRLNTQKGNFKYFVWIQRHRLLYKLKQKLKDSNYFNSFETQFEYVFTFEKTYLHLARQIKDILTQKVQFWRQVGNQSPIMAKMQSIGSSIVERMFNLNQYYYKKVKQQESKINNFNATILYSMYLLSTTNYKELAEKLIKNTTRTLESIQIHEENLAQTFGIRVLIKDTLTSQNQKINNFEGLLDAQYINQCLQLQSDFNLHDQNLKAKNQNSIKAIKQLQKKSKNSKFNRYKAYLQEGFVQVIVNISGSLCKLLKVSKNQIINETINKLLPIAYQEQHHKMLSNVLHFKKKTNKPIIKPLVLDRQRQVPFRTRDNKLLISKVSIKIFDSFNEGLSFIAVVQKIKNNKHFTITDLNGQILQSQEGFNSLDLIKSNQIQSQIQISKQQWHKNKLISKKTISLAYNNSLFEINLASPFQNIWQDKRSKWQDKRTIQQDKKQKNQYQKTKQYQETQNEAGQLLTKINEEKYLSQPPIHIEIKNDLVPFLAGGKKDREEQMKRSIQKMQSEFVKVDNQSQSSSKTSSSKQSVVSVVSSFAQNMFIPFYNSLAILFTSTFFTIILGTILSYLLFALPWDNSGFKNNPIINVLSIMDIRSHSIQTVNFQLDLDQYYHNPAINQTNVALFYGLQDFPNAKFNDWVSQKMDRIAQSFKIALTSTTNYVASILDEIAKTQWTTQVLTLNTKNTDPAVNWQSLPLTSIIMNYYIDIEFLSHGNPFQNTMISLNFWKNVEYLLSNTNNMKNIISNSISTLITTNVMFLCVILVFALLSIVPLFLMFKKRITRHIQIYDLVASVDGKMIGQQIRKLVDIIKIVNKSNQSSEVLKSNTINYITRKRSSQNIQLIDGLISKQNKLENVKSMKQIDSIRQQDIEQMTLQQSATINSSGKKEDQSILQVLQNHVLCKNPTDSLTEYENKKLKIRKRVGQLDLKGSQADKKTIVYRHLIIYLLILISAVGILLIIITKIDYFQQTNSTALKLDDMYQSMIDLNLLILNTKMFFRGTVNASQQYRDTTFIQWLDKKIYAQQVLTFQTGYNDSTLEPACSQSITMMESRYLFCQSSSYSLVTLRQQISESLRLAYQSRVQLNKKYNLSLNNMSLVPQYQLNAISQQLFYVQSLSSKLTNLTTLRIVGVQQQMYLTAADLNNSLYLYCMLTILWTFLALIAGIFIINDFKQDFSKQVVIVSFLNLEMIQTSKRVQSFLQTLSKSSS